MGELSIVPLLGIIYNGMALFGIKNENWIVLLKKNLHSNASKLKRWNSCEMFQIWRFEERNGLIPHGFQDGYAANIL